MVDWEEIYTQLTLSYSLSPEEISRMTPAVTEAYYRKLIEKNQENSNKNTDPKLEHFNTEAEYKAWARQQGMI